MNESHRKAKLKELIAIHYKGDRSRFIAESKLSKSRVAQMLSEKYQFGEAAAQTVLDRLPWLDRNWFSLPEGSTRKLSVAERQDPRIGVFYDLPVDVQDSLINTFLAIVGHMPKKPKPAAALAEVK